MYKSDSPSFKLTFGCHPNTSSAFEKSAALAKSPSGLVVSYSISKELDEISNKFKEDILLRAAFSLEEAASFNFSPQMEL